MKCIEVTKTRNIDHYWSLRSKAGEVKSLVNMLQRSEVMTINNGDYYVGDLSAIFQILRSEGFDKKREREDNYEDQVRPAKRMTIVMSN